MRNISVVVLVAVILAVTATASFAQQYPNVKNLKPFSPETNFMSQAGYLRWVTYQQSNTWLSVAEAQRIVNSQ